MTLLQPLPVFAVNLKSRPERRDHIRKEFDGRAEFMLTIVEAEEHERGAMGLWKTISKLLRTVAANQDDLLILCEDDHQFTADYSPALLLEGISRGRELGADVVLGGVSWFSGALQVTDGLFWVDKFSGLQFTVIYRKFFSTILDANFGPRDVPDYKIAALTDHKFFIHPFISTQREFGYSDATKNNNVAGHVDTLFRNSAECAHSLKYITDVYRDRRRLEEEKDVEIEEDFSIPTYVIHSSGREDRLNHIQTEFSGKSEFSMTVVEATSYPATAQSLMLDIRKIVDTAESRGEEVIIICEDDHRFTEHHTRDYLMRNIVDAYTQNAEILSGGVGRFDQVVPVTESLYWVNSISHLQFIVLFRSVFAKVLDEPIGDITDIKEILTQVTSHKMLLFPFVSTKIIIDPQDSHVDSPADGSEQQSLPEQFTTTSSRLDRILKKRKAFRQFQSAGVVEGA